MSGPGGWEGREVTKPVSDQVRLCTLLAMLRWQRDANGDLFPPNELRVLLLGVDAESEPPDLDFDDRWTYLSEVAHHFEQLLPDCGTTESRQGFILAMRVLDTFEPLDVEVADVIGSMLPVETAGRLWVEDVTATAWRIASSFHGSQCLAELQHNLSQ